MSSFTGNSHLHAKGEDRDEDFHYKGQSQLPHGGVNSRASSSVRQVIPFGAVEIVHILAELGRVQNPTVVEELRNQLAGAHSGVLVGEGQNGRDRGHHEHLQHGVFTKLGRLASPAPGNVAANEERSPKPTKYSQKDERHKLQKMPRHVKLHVEENQAAVPERVDGAQGERSHQSSEEGAPQRLERKVVTDLKKENQSRFSRFNTRHYTDRRPLTKSPAREGKAGAEIDVHWPRALLSSQAPRASF